MKAKHTPGPWEKFEDKNGVVRVGGAEHSVASINNPFLDNEANARLIATAPELLEALKEASNQLTSDGHCPALIASIDAVIAKATGGD